MGIFGFPDACACPCPCPVLALCYARNCGDEVESSLCHNLIYGGYFLVSSCLDFEFCPAGLHDYLTDVGLHVHDYVLDAGGHHSAYFFLGTSFHSKAFLPDTELGA